MKHLAIVLWFPCGLHWINLISDAVVKHYKFSLTSVSSFLLQLNNLLVNILVSLIFFIVHASELLHACSPILVREGDHDFLLCFDAKPSLM